jgi:copper transport protein
MRRLRVLAGALPAALAAALLASGTVLAHAELVSSTPAANASLLESPATVSMTFSEPIDPATASVRLLDDLQQALPGIGSVRVDATGLVASVDLPTLDPGVYTVSYRVTSATDGHVSAGIWAFLVDPTGSQPPPAVAAQSSSPSGDALTVAVRWVALAAALMLLGLAAFWLVSARPALATAGAATTAPWGMIATTAAVALGALWAYLTIAARPFVEASAGHSGRDGETGFPLDFAAPFGATPFADAMRLGEIGLGAAVLLAIARLLSPSSVRRGDDRLALWMVAGAGAIALAGSSLAGHAAARGGLLFAGIDWLHLLAVAAWVGTLPGLLLLARRSHRLGTDGRHLFGNALRRHSRLALAAAPIVALTGIANSPLVLGDARGLVASTYGNVLLAKVLLFSVAMAIGAANFFLVRADALRRTVSLIGVELVVAALAILAASNLVATEPAAGRVPVLTHSAIGTLHLYGEVGASTIHAAVILPAPGEQQYRVSVADTGTGDYRTDVQKVILVFGAPEGSGLPDQRVELDPGATPWLWAGRGAYTPIVGDWSLEVLVRRVGERDEAASFDLPIAEPLPPALASPPDTGIGVPLPLAWLWVALPRGPAGWLVPLTLLAGFVGASILERRRGRRPPASLPAVRLALAALVVVSGLGIGSRSVAEVANQAPATAAAQPNPIAASTASTARGRDLYLANCAACHGTTGAGDGLTAAGLVPGPGNLASSVPARTDGELAYLIASGTVATRMPAFSITLSENDRWDLVNYLRATWAGTTR